MTNSLPSSPQEDWEIELKTCEKCHTQKHIKEGNVCKRCLEACKHEHYIPSPCGDQCDDCGLLRTTIDYIKNMPHSAEQEVRTVDWELKHCLKCHQMTNHGCLKCLSKEYEKGTTNRIREQVKDKIKTDLLTIADKGEYEDLRRDVEEYFSR